METTMLVKSCFSSSGCGRGRFPPWPAAPGRRTWPGCAFPAAAVDRRCGWAHFLRCRRRPRLDVLVGADVAGVDADLVGAGVQRGQGRLVVEVDVRHHRDVHRLLDGGHHRGVLRGGHRDADDLAAGLGHPFGLGHIAGNVLDRHVEHCLHGNGVIAADGDVSDFDDPFQFALGHRGPPFLQYGGKSMTPRPGRELPAPAGGAASQKAVDVLEVTNTINNSSRSCRRR